MVDIHTHILPAVDDGASDLATALKMLTIAESSGTVDIIATPHIVDKHTALPWASILEQTAQLECRARLEGLTIKIHPGAELEMNPEVLLLIKQHLPSMAYGLAGSRYTLVELPSSMIPHYAAEFWNSLYSHGLRPIIAHPERHMQLMQQPDTLDKWRADGLLIQCTANSITGVHGSKVQKHAEILLAKGYVDFVATDAHNNNHRNTNLASCAQWLTDKLGEEFKNKLLYTTPQNILHNRPI